ncbi:MAG: hypothetical protein LBC18_11625 [Opitutaceae bacterium]|nr:hypothetical protein [Opitutaceae bacterium]
MASVIAVAAAAVAADDGTPAARGATSAAAPPSCPDDAPGHSNSNANPIVRDTAIGKNVFP